MEFKAPKRIWAWRHTACRGWHWEPCRICGDDTAKQWLKVFQDDEPDVLFRISRTTPSVPAQ